MGETLHLLAYELGTQPYCACCELSLSLSLSLFCTRMQNDPSHPTFALRVRVCPGFPDVDGKGSATRISVPDALVPSWLSGSVVPSLQSDSQNDLPAVLTAVTSDGCIDIRWL